MSLFRRRRHVVSPSSHNMNGSRKLQVRWKAKKGARRKKQLPKFCGLNKSAKSLTLGRFSPGCSDTPFLYLLWRKRSHLLKGQTLGQEDSKQSSEKQADTIIHCLCLRGAESWDVRVCDSDLVDLFQFGWRCWVVVGVFGEGEEEFWGQSDVIKYQLSCETCWFLIVVTSLFYLEPCIPVVEDFEECFEPCVVLNILLPSFFHFSIINMSPCLISFCLQHFSMFDWAKSRWRCLPASRSSSLSPMPSLLTTPPPEE